MLYPVISLCVCVCVFSQGRYCEAVDQWEVMKEAGVADAGIYTSVMKMATTVGGVEAAQHVKEDMERQEWNMDHRYIHIYITHTCTIVILHFLFTCMYPTIHVYTGMVHVYTYNMLMWVMISC